MDAWPLIGRADLLARVVAALTLARGGGTIITGPAGTGKTRLLAAARDRVVRSGVPVYWAVATRAAAGVPLGPFAPLLPAAADGAGLTAQLSLAATTLTQERRAVAVDDAHLLDPASAALVAHLLANTAVPVVLTARTTGTWAWLRDLPRIGLTPLDAAQVAEVLEAALGAPVETALAVRLTTLSEGNPLLLRELVDAARAAGTLARDSDVWQATGPLVVAANLPTAIEARLDRLPPDVRAAAELVALAEPVEAAVLEVVLSPAARAGLDAERLLSEAGVPSGAGARLRLVHPLYAESLRATMPPLRAREHRRRLAAAAAPHDLIRAVVWALDGGLPVEPGRLLDAARQASDGLDHELAGRLARAAVEAGGGFEAKLALLSELPYEGRAEEALALASALDAEAVDDAAGLRLAAARSRLELVLGRVGPARATLATARSRARSREVRTRLALQQAAQAFSTGHIGLSLGYGEEILRQAPDDPFVLGRLAMSRVRALACAGRTGDAIALAERTLEAMATDRRAETDEATRAALIRMTLLQALAFHGRLIEATDLGTAGMAGASRGPAAALRAFWAHELGQVAALRGHAGTARRWLHEALAVMPIAGLPASPHLWSLDGLAEAAAHLGDAAGAAAAVERLREVLPAGFVPPRCGGAVWAVAAAGEVSRAQRLALRYGRELEAVGSTLMAAWVLHDAARLGMTAVDPAVGVRSGAAVRRGGPELTVAGEIARLAAGCQSPLVHALAANAAALAGTDPVALDRSAATLAAIGCDLWAAEAATRASRLHRRAGSTGSALSSAAVADRLLAGCGPVRSERADVTDPLTAREQEVAGLAARGLSDRDIAARLQLSVRTVQSHLYRSYRKLGVADRAQLPGGRAPATSD